MLTLESTFCSHESPNLDGAEAAGIPCAFVAMAKAGTIVHEKTRFYASERKREDSATPLAKFVPKFDGQVKEWSVQKGANVHVSLTQSKTALILRY